MAFDAFLRIDLEFQHIPSGNKPQKGAQGTEITAPVSFFFDVEKNEADEQDSDEESLDEGGIDRQAFEKLDEDVP